MRVWGLVAAAGSGRRMGEGGPKQFRDAGGMPILAHTLRALLAPGAIDGITVAVAEAFLDWTQGIVSDYFGKGAPITCVVGGPTRQESVYRGLVSLADKGIDIVVIHDGARPLVGPEVIRAAVEAAREHGAAVAAIPATDASCLAEAGFITGYIDRGRHYTIQTPQAFRLDLIVRAHEAAVAAEITDAVDDGVLVLGMGKSVAVIAGSPENIKVTHQADLRSLDKIIRGS